MKMNRKWSRVVLLALFIMTYLVQLSSAQDEKPGIGRGSLDSQMRYIIYESDKIDNSRLVKSWWLYTMRKQVGDTLDLMHGDILSLNDTIGQLGVRIDSLNVALAVTKTDLAAVTVEKGNIEVLGVVLKKAVYNVIMWTIVTILTIALLLFIVMFKRSHVVTKEARNDLKDLKEEYEAFRKRALEREREVTRKLYDEVLKYKNKIGAD